MMSLEQFRATGRDSTNLDVDLGDDSFSGVAGRVYDDGLYLERWIDDRFGVAPPNGEPTWLLTLSNLQFYGTIEQCEEQLYLWALGEGCLK